MGRKGRTSTGSAIVSLCVCVALSVPVPSRAGSITDECFGLAPTITGSPGSDLLEGTSGPDVIHGGDGDDVLLGGGGNDVLCGGDGNDLVSGGKGIDFVVGGTGADTVRGDHGADWIFDVDPTVEVPKLLGLLPHAADEDQDALLGGPGADFLAGEGGDDVLDGGKGQDIVHGLSVSDPLVVDLGAGFVASAAGGVDLLRSIEHAVGGLSSDLIVGNSGDNVLGGLRGSDRVFGGAGDDVLYATLESSYLAGGGDPGDLLWIAAAVPTRVDLATGTARSLEPNEARADVVHGFGNVQGTPFDDVLIGDAGDNELAGVGGSDRLIGSGGDDTLLGDGPDYVRSLFEEGRSGGQDFLDGGAGTDVADGGPRKDGCVNAEKAMSCEVDDAPPGSDCPDPDPNCSSPMNLADRTGVLTTLFIVSDRSLDTADLDWIASMLARFVPSFDR